MKILVENIFVTVFFGRSGYEKLRQGEGFIIFVEEFMFIKLDHFGITQECI